MTNQDKSMRSIAADLFEIGMGYKSVAAYLGVNRETVREWSYTWRALGREGLLADVGTHVEYPGEVKLAAVTDRLRGDSMIEVMARYKIPNRNRIKQWCKAYKKHGAAAFGINVGKFDDALRRAVYRIQFCL